MPFAPEVRALGTSAPAAQVLAPSACRAPYSHHRPNNHKSQVLLSFVIFQMRRLNIKATQQPTAPAETGRPGPSPRTPSPRLLPHSY